MNRRRQGSRPANERTAPPRPAHSERVVAAGMVDHDPPRGSKVPAGEKRKRSWFAMENSQPLRYSIGMTGVETPYARLEIEQLKEQIERLTAEVADLRAAQRIPRGDD